MAPPSATLDVTFTSHYAGIHRICWRIGNTGSYDCSTTVNCTGSGATCTVSIPIVVDNESCDPVTYNGYVQAICEEIGSLNGRISFTVTFTPSEPCKAYLVRCNSVGVRSVTITDRGSGYSPSHAPALTFISGGGSLAAADVVIGNGGIKTWTITNGGTVYNGGGSANFLNKAAVTLTGVGTGAHFHVQVTSGVVTGIMLVSQVTGPGSDYAINDTFKFAASDLGGNAGTECIITVNSLNTGEVQYIQVTDQGSGYTSVPTVVIDPSPDYTGENPEVNATGTTVLDCCDKFNITQCNDGNIDLTLCLGQQIEIGVKTPVTLPTGYTQTLTGCAYDCREVQFTLDDPDHPATITYWDCTTGDFTRHELVNTTPYVVCVVNNSWFVTPESSVVHVVVGPVCSPSRG